MDTTVFTNPAVLRHDAKPFGFSDDPRLAALMRMPIFLLRRGDILWGFIVAMAVAVLVFVSVKYPRALWQHGSGSNFGPDWDCQYVPNSEPVCIKRTPKRAPN